MALCESPYHGAELSLTGSLPNPMSSPFNNTHPTNSTPLMLPRDWPDTYYLPSTLDPQHCDSYEFQSNRLENSRLSSEVLPSLSGLGIRNTDLDKDLDTKDFQFTTYTPGDISPIQNSLRHNRHYRADSDYGTYSKRANSSQSLQVQQPVCHPTPDSWIFSSILRAAEFSASDATFEQGQSLALESEASAITSQLLDGSQLLGDAEEDMNWSFEKLSAATGLSVADFAAQISATAEATLKQMSVRTNLAIPASLPLTSSNGGTDAPLMNTFDDNNEPLSWPPFSACDTDVPSPFVDINLRTLDLSWNINCIGVDPADILPNSSSSSSRLALQTVDSSISSDFGDALTLGSGPHASPQVTYITNFEMPPTQSNHLLDLGAQSPPLKVQSPPQESYSLPPVDTCQASDDEGFQSPSTSEYSPSVQPLGSKRNHASRHNTRRVTQHVDLETFPTEYPHDISKQHLPHINLGTPVFDAHRGIPIEELKAKAERYRLRNQGRDYDKRWLISFAGKLSVRGELVDEFRCYVAGCKQVNKRRDHILIHVGAHLDQRPFKCLHCSARFLRKNECKRHELSHTGIRPFSCHLCPTPATTFVRQDLLKRHMKRTHQLDLKIDKENEELPRPRKRTKY